MNLQFNKPFLRLSAVKSGMCECRKYRWKQITLIASYQGKMDGVLCDYYRHFVTANSFSAFFGVFQELLEVAALYIQAQFCTLLDTAYRGFDNLGWDRFCLNLNKCHPMLWGSF